jgi:serine protease Do
MLDPVRAKARLIAVTAAAFTGGILLASGLEWTSGSQAALLQSAPSRSEVQPVAELSQAFISIAESVTPAVVSITTSRDQRGRGRPMQQQLPPGFQEMFPGFPMRQQPETQVAGGSGFLITGDGYIVTNNHVIEGADRIDVVLQDNRRLSARLVGRDPTTDIAVIKVDGQNFPTTRFAEGGSTRVGEWVLAVGNPLNLGLTVTSGIVSAKGRKLDILGGNMEQGLAGNAVEDFIQTDAAINPGNSGGPLVNLRGDVVGVNTAIASRTGLSAGYGFAVPVELARRVADDLIRYGRVRRPILGVSIADVFPEDAEVYRLPSVAGVLIQGFSGVDSPAQRAGLRQGDVVVAVNGQPVQRVNELQRVIRTQQPGETVTLEAIRGGRRQQFRVQLMEAPAARTAAAAAETPAAAPAADARLGFSFEPLTPAFNQRLQLGYPNPTGVIVTEVQPYGPASERVIRGFKIVRADGQPVTDAAQFSRIVAGKRSGQILQLVLEDPEGQQRIANIRIGG